MSEGRGSDARGPDSRGACRRSFARRGAVALAIACCAGCATVRVEVAPGPPSRVVVQREGAWVAAAAAPRLVDVSAICPAGVVALSETSSATDVLETIATLGLRWPRTRRFECRGEPRG